MAGAQLIRCLACGTTDRASSHKIAQTSSQCAAAAKPALRIDSGPRRYDAAFAGEVERSVRVLVDMSGSGPDLRWTVAPAASPQLLGLRQHRLFRHAPPNQPYAEACASLFEPVHFTVELYRRTHRPRMPIPDPLCPYVPLSVSPPDESRVGSCPRSR
jgi:hypothetical protein